MTEHDAPAVPVPMADVLSALHGDPTRIDITTDPTKRRLIGTTFHDGLSFDVPFMTEVADNLWQGGCTNGLVLPEFIDHLVSLYPWESYETSHLESYLVLAMYDSVTQGFEDVLDVASWVNSRRRTGPVLIHCQAGLNRSAVVVGAALVMAGEMTGPQAVDHLRQVRSPACLCNPAFAEWLAGLKFDDGLLREQGESHPEWQACKKPGAE